MALTTFYWGRFQALDDNGAILSNGYLEFFEAGTSTPLPVYADVDGNSSLGVVVTANISGVFPQMFMLPQAYDINLYDENDVLIDSVVDFFPPQAASSANSDVTGLAGVTFAAGEGAYLSDGSGGLNAGQWYKWDADLAYASETPQTAFAVSAITAGETGLFRTAGKVTGLSGLTPGALYYISGTAGALSSTPGAFSRMVGQAESTTVLVVQTNPPVAFSVIDARLKNVVDGRLTLTSGTPVTKSDVTAATTIYFALYTGNQVALYTGTRWIVVTFAEMSLPVPATTATMYDLFMDYNDGTPQLVALAWTNDTTRATALAKQDGVYVKTGDTQQRYLGSFRTTGVSGQTEDSFAKRYLWNYYNRVDRGLRVMETANSWTYDSATYQQANANAANQLDIVVGVDEVELEAQVIAHVANSAGSTAASVSIGTNVANASTSGTLITRPTVAAAATIYALQAALKLYPAVGRSFYPWIESGGGATTTFYGDNNSPTLFQSGIHGSIQG